MFAQIFSVFNFVSVAAHAVRSKRNNSSAATAGIGDASPVLPLPVAHRLKSSTNVSVFRDIPYTSTSPTPLSPTSQFHAEPLHSRHLLDIYVPTEVLRSAPAKSELAQTNSDSDSVPAVAPARTPASAASVPVLLYTHGGGWVRGDKKSKFRGAPGVGRTMAENGVVTVCISYRLAKPSIVSMLVPPLVWSLILSILITVIAFILSFVIPSIHSSVPFLLTFPFFSYLYFILLALVCVWPFVSGYVFPLVPSFARYGAYQYQQQLEDVAQAILFVKKNLKHLVPQADTDNIFLAGHSAGAHLVSQLTFTHDAVFKALEEQQRNRAKHISSNPKSNDDVANENGLSSVQRPSAVSSTSVSSPFNFLRDIRGVIAISGVYNVQNPFSDNPADLKNRLFRATYGWGAFGCDPRILDQASPLYHLRQRNQRIAAMKGGLQSNQSAILNGPAAMPLLLSSAISSSSSSSSGAAAALPPFLVFSAESDLGLEFDANRFVSALSLSDIRHRFVNVANSSHASIASRFERHATKDAMMQFIKEELDKAA